MLCATYTQKGRKGRQMQALLQRQVQQADVLDIIKELLILTLIIQMIKTCQDQLWHYFKRSLRDELNSNHLSVTYHPI